MVPREIKRIMNENEKFTDMLEEFDRTGEFPLDKIRRSFTLKKMTVNKLKRVSKKTGHSMSDIIDSVIENKLEG